MCGGEKVAVQITGRNLELVWQALELADLELHNQIATCPDVIEFAEDIELIEEEQRQLARLKVRVERALNRGG